MVRRTMFDFAKAEFKVLIWHGTSNNVRLRQGYVEQCGSSSVGRAIAFQAIGREFEPRFPLCDVIGRCSSVVEHFLGKEEVVSSILINGSGMEVGSWMLEVGYWKLENKVGRKA